VRNNFIGFLLRVNFRESLKLFLPDQPIKSDSQDALGRKRFAHSLSDTILAHKDPNSLVIGLYGDWGSGKTSLLNLILENIERPEASDKPVIVKFNPWNFSDQNQLISQFFHQLNSTLGSPKRLMLHCNSR